MTGILVKKKVNILLKEIYFLFAIQFYEHNYWSVNDVLFNLNSSIKKKDEEYILQVRRVDLVVDSVSYRFLQRPILFKCYYYLVLKLSHIHF